MTENGRFRREVLPHLDHLHSVARSMIRDRANSGDLVLQTLMKARDQYRMDDPDEDVRAWLTRIMNELWLDQFRSNNRGDDRKNRERHSRGTSRRKLDVSGFEPWAEDLQFEDVREALMRIPAPYRRLLVLSMSDELDVHRVAQQQDMAPKRVRWQFERAKQLLKDELSSDEGNWDGNLQISETD